MENYSPFSPRLTEQVASVTETELICRIRGWLGDSCPEAPKGIGDDCAVTSLDSQAKYLLTTVDGVGWKKHFDERVPSEMAGRKLLARNLSDIASMGGVPVQAVVSLWLAGEVSLRWLQRFYEGIATLALEYGVSIVGGDVSSAPEGVFIADLCLEGFCEKSLLRRQVKAGDTLWVTGALGGSLLEKHYAFTPRLAEGQWLQRSGWAKSMIDVSDGLGKDMPSLVGGYRVKVFDLPVSDDAREMAKASGRSAIDHALNDGEDYELLFAVDSSCDELKLVEQWQRDFTTPLTKIGLIESATSDGTFEWVDETGVPLKPGRGYEHF